MALDAAAVVLDCAGDSRSALELLAAADAIRERSGQGRRPWEVRARMLDLDRIGAAVEPDEARAARAVGARHDLPAAAALALRALRALDPA